MALESISVVVPLREQFIPADLLANYKARIISIECEDEVIQKISIHPKAFRASQNFTRNFFISSCDVGQLDFTFLNGFHGLQLIRFILANNFHLAVWTSLPPLSHLTGLELFSSSGLDEWTSFPVLVQGLTEIFMHNTFLCDLSTDRILQWVIDSPSVNTLRYLHLDKNFLTRIPKQIRALSKLNKLVLTGNKITTIEKESIYRNSSTRCEIFLDVNEISNIEPGAFQG